MGEQVTIAGGVTIHSESTRHGLVHRMSDWARAEQLVAQGILTARSYGPATYGHVSYFVVGDRELSADQTTRSCGAPSTHPIREEN
jgi:hypothetical protein